MPPASTSALPRQPANATASAVCVTPASCRTTTERPAGVRSARNVARCSSDVPPMFLRCFCDVLSTFLRYSVDIPLVDVLPMFLRRSSDIPLTFLRRSSDVPPTFLRRSSDVPPMFLRCSFYVPPPPLMMPRCPPNDARCPPDDAPLPPSPSSSRRRLPRLHERARGARHPAVRPRRRLQRRGLPSDRRVGTQVRRGRHRRDGRLHLLLGDPTGHHLPHPPERHRCVSLSVAIWFRAAGKNADRNADQNADKNADRCIYPPVRGFRFTLKHVVHVSQCPLSV